MIPENRESSWPMNALYLAPDNDPGINLLVDYERGGIDVNDPSEGLRVKPWQFYFDGDGIFCTAEDVVPFLILETTGVTELSGSFDQNMRPCVAYMKDNECHLNWWDTWTSSRQDDVFVEQRSPRLTLDDKRSSQFGNSDVIFGYMRGQSLCYRQQRDRYTIERVLRTDLPEDIRLKNIGMMSNWRLKFNLG